MGINVPSYRYASFALNWRHYRIPIGEEYTGNMLYLVFANDHDVSNPTGESYFSNVQVFEDPSLPAQPPVDVGFGNYTISPYAGSSESPALSLTIEDNGDTLHMVGNGWQKMSLPYTVKSNTVIEFDYKSTSQGEVQGIGFDADNSRQTDQTFQLYGTDPWGLNAFQYAGYAPGWKHFRIPVGKYYTGAIRYIFFVNDHDVASPTSENYFRNLSVYEGEVSLPVSVDFNQYALSLYRSPMGANLPTINILDNGNTLHLSGNGWTQISMPVAVTQNTVLAFDFQSTAQGEVHGIGFDTDQFATEDKTFKLYGTQNYGLTAFNDYTASAPNWKHYIIPVGQYYTGQMLYLFFVHDHDVANPTAESYFRNVQIYNLPPTATPTATLTYTPTATFTPTRTPTATPTNTPMPKISGTGTCWISGPAWPDYTVYYDIVTSSLPAGFTEEDWVASIEAAAQTWTNVAPSHFTFVRQVSSINTISYQVPQDDEYLAGTAAWSYDTQENPNSPDDPYYDQAYTRINPLKAPFTVLNPPSNGAINLQTLMTHEFGHWLYLDDLASGIGCSDSIMSGVDRGDGTATSQVDLSNYDEDGINYKYP